MAGTLIPPQLPGVWLRIACRSVHLEAEGQNFLLGVDMYNCTFKELNRDHYFPLQQCHRGDGSATIHLLCYKAIIIPFSQWETQIHFFLCLGLNIRIFCVLANVLATRQKASPEGILSLRVAKFMKKISEEESIDFVALDVGTYLRAGRHRMNRIFFMVDGERGTSIT